MSITEQENMLPWEYSVFISLLKQQLEKEAQDRNLRQQMAKFG